MNKLFIFRFGATCPLLKEKPIIETISADSGIALGLSTSCGTLSIVLTSFSPSQIVELYQRVADETSDELPVIVWPVEAGADNLQGGLFDGVEGLIAEFNEMTCQAPINLTLDELLELISVRGGVDKLSQSELARLKELTQ